jgi:hypothetical protein
MVRPLALLPLLTLVALPARAPAEAGLPDAVSGRMVLDEVTDGLRRYRLAKYPVERARWLEKLAPSRDPRVGVALGEAMEKAAAAEAFDDARRWATLLLTYYKPDPIPAPRNPFGTGYVWWHKNQSDLRRQARDLPR